MTTGYVYKRTFNGKVFWNGYDWVKDPKCAKIMTFGEYTETWSVVARTIVKFQTNQLML